LSEPKAHVFIDPPSRPHSQEKFAKAVAKHGVHLDPRSQLLFHGRRFFINGERLDATSDALPALRRLADQRHLSPMQLGGDLLQALYEWYRSGYLKL
jgi:50S ribosomal protein L16 3-hydroxylase